MVIVNYFSQNLSIKILLKISLLLLLILPILLLK